MGQLYGSSGAGDQNGIPGGGVYGTGNGRVFPEGRGSYRDKDAWETAGGRVKQDHGFSLGSACGDRSGSAVSEGPLPVCKQRRSPGCRFRKRRRPVSSRSQGTPHSPGILRAGYEAAGDREVTRKKSYILGGFGGYFV